MTTATKPLPPMGEDPSIVKGQQIRHEFPPQAQSIRSDRSLTDLQAAEQVVDLWTRTNDKLTELYRDLQRRRQARLDALETLVPLGPAVPSDASAADAAVLHQAFRSALAEARQAMPARAEDGMQRIDTTTTTLDSMLADAEKFDDDNLRRAVLTAAFEAGHMQIVRRWTDLMGVTQQLDEFHELQRAVAGQGLAGSWNFTVFSPLRPPEEVAKLERLRAEQERAAQFRAEQVAAANRYRMS
jgi:hypothetical protein